MAGRPKKSEAEKLVSVGLSISPAHETELRQIAVAEDRERGYLTRAFYLRGLAAYKRDGLLLEPVVKREALTPADEFDAARAHVSKSARKKAPTSTPNRNSDRRKR